jgi:hypothetical protein
MPTEGAVNSCCKNHVSYKIYGLQFQSKVSCGNPLVGRPDNDVHVDMVRLRLWTVATSGLLFIPQVIHEHGEP